MRRLLLRTSFGNGVFAAMAVLVFYAVATPAWTAAKGWPDGGLSLTLVAAVIQALGWGVLVIVVGEVVRFFRAAARKGS